MRMITLTAIVEDGEEDKTLERLHETIIDCKTEGRHLASEQAPKEGSKP